MCACLRGRGGGGTGVERLAADQQEAGVEDAQLAGRNERLGGLDQHLVDTGGALGSDVHPLQQLGQLAGHAAADGRVQEALADHERRAQGVVPAYHSQRNSNQRG